MLLVFPHYNPWHSCPNTNHQHRLVAQLLLVQNLELLPWQNHIIPAAEAPAIAALLAF